MEVMWSAAAPSGVCLCVDLTDVPCKTAEPIVLPFGDDSGRP